MARELHVDQPPGHTTDNLQYVNWRVSGQVVDNAVDSGLLGCWQLRLLGLPGAVSIAFRAIPYLCGMVSLEPRRGRRPFSQFEQALECDAHHVFHLEQCCTDRNIRRNRAKCADSLHLCRIATRKCTFWNIAAPIGTLNPEGDALWATLALGTRVALGERHNQPEVGQKGVKRHGGSN